MKFILVLCVVWAAIATCKARTQVYFDISVRDRVLGRVAFELLDDIVPKTVNNFVQFCTRPEGQGYKGSKIHRVVRDEFLQGGDFLNGDGTGATSIYGYLFEDENFTVNHLSSPYMLTMANKGPDTNGSQFIITLRTQPSLNRRHVAFGSAISGGDLLKEIGRFATDEKRQPEVDVIISDCGLL